MKSPVTKFDDALLADAKRFLEGIEAHPEIFAALGSYGFDEKALVRGRFVVRETARAFECERAGTAWNYISPTADRREKEARYWYRDARRRYRQGCFRAAEAALRSGSGVGAMFKALGHTLRAFSIAAALAQRGDFRRELSVARGERPTDAPLPKDTVLVELSGWYDRWSLAARQVFRDSPDSLTPLGLTPGRAPRRLRNKNDRFGRSSVMRHADPESKTGE